MEKTIKRIFVSTVMLMAVVSGWAQGLTATLQQGTTMKTFYGVDAFKEAYAAASSGAVITLSAGTFNTVDSITKTITLIGNGATESSSTNLNNASSNTKDGWPYKLVIKANDVRIEGIYLSGSVIIRAVSNLKIDHCNISTLRATHQHKNTIIDQCYITNEYAIGKGENYCLKNSFIFEPHQSGSSSNLAYITNCQIYRYCYVHTNTEENKYSLNVYPFAIYKNCILGYHWYQKDALSNTNSNWSKGYWVASIETRSQSEFYNNVFYYYPVDYDNGSSSKWPTNDYLKTLKLLSVPSGTNRIGNMISTYSNLFNPDKYYYQPGFIKTDLKGDDGKQVGPYGGSGFSLIPSIPRITSSTIDSYTNAEGKINVKIKVENNQ